MNLHTAVERQWDSVDPGEWNVFQKVAHHTGGIITPANAVTVAGAMFVASGLVDIYNGSNRRGLYKVAAGRSLDIADGWVAEWTGTKSPLGEALDATVDKLAIAGMLYVFYQKEIIGKETALHILSQNAANTVISLAAKADGVEVHPSRAGKYAMLLQGTTLLADTLAATARNEGNVEKAAQLRILARVTEAGAGINGACSTGGYLKVFIENRKSAV